MAAKKKKPAKRLRVEEVGVTDTPEKPEEKSSLKDTRKVKKESPVKEVKEETAVDDKVSEEKAAPDSEEETPEKDLSDTKLSSFKLADVKETAEKPATEEKTDDEKEVETKLEEAPSVETSEDKLPEVKPVEKPQDSQDSKEKGEDWLEDVKPEDQEGFEESEGGGKKKIFLIILLLIVLAGVVAGGIYYYQTSLSSEPDVQKVEEQGQVVAPTEAPTEEEGEEATQSAEVVADDYSVNVLNGSGIVGEAGKVKTLLEGAEFEEIDTGNADSYDYIETEVSLKENSPEALYDLIKESLESDYIVSRSETDLDEDSDYDVEVIVGSKKVET